MNDDQLYALEQWRRANPYYRVALEANWQPRTADQKLAAEVAEKKAAAELERKRMALTPFGVDDDDWPEGTVFRFSKRFAENGTAYLYAAIKANGKWYTTGPKSPKGYSYEELCLWLVSGITTEFRDIEILLVKESE